MDTKEIISQKLSAAGWKMNSLAGKPNIDLRMTLKTGGNHVKIDHRFKNQSIWIWFIGANDCRCIGIIYDTNINQILDEIIQRQNELSFENYMSNYFDLQNIGDVSIMCWEQFSDAYADFNDDLDEKINQAQEAQKTLMGDNDPDPTVFPGQKVAKLSDYVKIMKMMQKGDMNGAFKLFGLDMMSYGQVAQQWGMKLAQDTTLTAKFTKMMQS